MILFVRKSCWCDRESETVSSHLLKDNQKLNLIVKIGNFQGQKMSERERDMNLFLSKLLPFVYN